MGGLKIVEIRSWPEELTSSKGDLLWHKYVDEIIEYDRDFILSTQNI